MLLIWDLHITSRYKDKILAELQSFVEAYPDEKNIIFLGDYVYHFSYDRNALMSLYHFFLELFKAGKHVYILAGNHDRLGNNFVFEEAKKAFEVMSNVKWEMINTQHVGQIKFITEPMLTEIEGEKIFFFPYFIDMENAKLEMWNEKSRTVNRSTLPVIQTLIDSLNKNEKLSWIANQILLDMVEKEKNLTVIHHHYINNTKFPGQKSIFHYKDVALDEAFLDMPDIKMISGHLHQAFAHKNYLCTGSVRSTSSLETNQMKYLRTYSNPAKAWQAAQMEAHELNINPYITLEETGMIDESVLLNQIENVREANRKNLSDSTTRKIKFMNKKNINLNSLYLSLKVDNIDYEHIEKFVDEDLRMKIKDIKLKKNIQDIEDIRENFETSGKNLSESFADRKQILKEYLQSKYPNDFQKYEETLHEMKLL